MKTIVFFIIFIAEIVVYWLFFGRDKSNSKSSNDISFDTSASYFFFDGGDCDCGCDSCDCGSDCSCGD